MTTTKQAGNTIFLIRGNEGNEEIVRVFRVTEDSKSPKRALTRFVNLILGTPEHDLHEAAISGELSYVSGHTKQVQLQTQRVVSFG